MSILSDIDDAVAVLQRGGLVALPTETVYGLAGDASDPLAIRQIYATKGPTRRTPRDRPHGSRC